MNKQPKQTEIAVQIPTLVPHKPKHDASHLFPHRFKPGQSGNPKGKPAGIRDKQARFREAMFDAVVGRTQKVTARVLDNARDKDLVGFIRILAGMLPREQQIDLAVKGTLAMQVSEMTDEELLRIAMAVDMEVIEQNGETNGEETCGPKAERSLGQDGNRPHTEGLPAPDTAGG